MLTESIRRAALTGIAAAALLPASAFAQSGAAPSEPGQQASGLDEIVVTAQKRSENLQHVPIAVSAFSASLMKNLGINAGADLPKLTPNLTINSGSNFFAAYLRGIGSQYANFGLDSSVATYLDDQYVSRPQAGLLQLNDLERIEVLKGPQGTLYGRNATGGAIRIITKDPTHKLEANAAFTYGRFDRIVGEAMLNLPLSDTLAIRVSAYHDQRDGYVSVIVPNTKKLQNRNTTTVRAKALWEPSPDLKVKLSLDYTRKRDTEGLAFINVDPSAPTQAGIAAGGTPSHGFYQATTDAFQTNRGFAIGSTDRGFGAQLRFDYDIGPATLSSITTYRRTQNINPQSDLDTVDLPILHDTYKERSRQITQELQVVSHGTSRFSYVAGLFYFRETGGNFFSIYGTSIDQSFGLPSGPNVGYPGGGAALNAFSRASVHSIAPYAELTYAFTDRLKLTLGGRYTWETKTLADEDVYATGVIPGRLPINDFSQKTKFKQFTPKALLSYQVTPRVLVYATYSRGFKSGGINTPAFVNTPPVKPEILDDYEVGWKTQFGPVRLNGAAFFYDYKGLQVQRTDQSTGGTRVENAANAKIYGLEGDLTWAVTRQFEFSAGGGYLHSRFKDYLGDAYVPAFQTPACATLGGAACIGYADVPNTNFSGRPLPQAPKFSGYVRAQYTQPLPAGSLQFSGLVSYSSKFYYNPEQSLSERARALLSGSITWRSEGEKYSFSVFGQNLTNRKYNILKTRQGSGGWRIPGEPITWGIRAGVAF